jgi:hypothetical protein
MLPVSLCSKAKAQSSKIKIQARTADVKMCRVQSEDVKKCEAIEERASCVMVVCVT